MVLPAARYARTELKAHASPSRLNGWICVRERKCVYVCGQLTRSLALTRLNHSE